MKQLQGQESNSSNLFVISYHFLSVLLQGESIMKLPIHMTIGEFSKLSGIRTDNLRFYNRIGLLIPEARGKNGYRYYTRNQLDSAFLISDLRSLGVGLDEIKQYASDRSPEGMLKIFQEQDNHIEAEITRLNTIREIMRLRADEAKKAMEYGDGAVFLEERQREPIFRCLPIEEGTPDDEGLLMSYDYAAEHHINLSYPFGTMVILPGEHNDFGISAYYFKVPGQCNAHKPACTYAVGYGRCPLGESYEVYLKLFDLMKANGLHAAGDAYEEYPLDEMSVQYGEPYCVRVEIPVKTL